MNTSPGSMRPSQAARTAATASGIGPNCSGSDRPWAIISPSALAMPVVKSMFSRRMPEYEARTSVKAISLTKKKSAFLTSSKVTGSPCTSGETAAWLDCVIVGLRGQYSRV